MLGIDRKVDVITGNNINAEFSQIACGKIKCYPGFGWRTLCLGCGAGTQV